MLAPVALLVPLLSALCAAAHTLEAACVIELECPECLPDNMPLVAAPTDHNGTLALAEGAPLTLSCGAGRFRLYPLLAELEVRCERGRYRAPHTPTPLHLLELGCQESALEDVSHHVAGCAPPLQGRAWVVRAHPPLHLAALCYDEDAGLARHLHTATHPLHLPPHEERAPALSVLGNFAQMFDERTRLDAERLYASDTRLTRRLTEALKPEGFPLAGQTLTSAPLLAPGYFQPEHARVAQFASNRVATWRGVAHGNLRHVHEDVARALRVARSAGERVHVYAGTHGTLSMGGRAVSLGGGGRFPVARYLWTAVVAGEGSHGVALVVLNDPLVRVSEVRDAVFCESRCSAVRWLRSLAHERAFERPAAGLTFCCELGEFSRAVPDMPRVFNHTVELLV